MFVYLVHCQNHADARNVLSTHVFSIAYVCPCVHQPQPQSQVDRYLVKTVSPSCKESTCLQHNHQAPVFVCRHSIYYGDAQLATEWFHKLGYTIPYLINAADFILDLASGDVSTNKITGAESRLHLISCAETFLSVSPACHQLITLLFCP